MPNITLSVPKELKDEMNTFPEMNWSEIARQAIAKRIKLLKEMDKILSKSKLTQSDAIDLGRELNRKLAKRYV